MSKPLPLCKPKSPSYKRFTDLTELPPIYAMICDGDCMAPDIKHGDVIGFDRDAPVERGDLAAFFLKPELVPPGKVQVGIKRIVVAPPPWLDFPFEEHPDSNVSHIVIAEQSNPRRQYQIPCARLLGIHKCVGRIPASEVTQS